VDHATEITVTLRDKREMKAEVVGTDPRTDIAVLKIDGANFPYVTLGDSSKVQVGDIALAIGDPFGVGQTLTSGIVSAMGRGNLGIEEVEDFIQTDAPINPGNSGGALADLQGRVVGINALIESPSGSVGAAQSAGIGFSIPIDFAKDVAAQLIAGKTVAHAYMGIGTVTVDATLGQQYDLGVTSGALVQSIQANSPAAKAGMKNGDVIVKIGDMDITSVEDVFTAVRSHKVGDAVPVVVVRNKAKTTLTVTLASDAAST
jgi:serine protease Do